MTYRLIRFVELIVMLLVLFFVAAGVTAQPYASALADPPPGYWPANSVYLPCSVAKPNIKGAGPDGTLGYMKYDATGTRVSPNPDGTRAGQGGAQHTIQVYLDGMMIGLCSGLACGSSTGPREMFPAPWRDVVMPNYGGTMLCTYWRNQALPGATLEACPNPRTPDQYAAKVMGTTEWLAGWPLQAPNRTEWCVPPRPTWTPTGAASPTKTPTPIAAGPHQFDDWIYQMVEEGYSMGCGGGKFCPDRPVTRGELAVYILKVVHGPDYVPPKCQPPGDFLDVPCGLP